MTKIKLRNGSTIKTHPELRTFTAFFTFRPLKRHKRTIEDLVKKSQQSEITVRRHLKWLQENDYVAKKRILKGAQKGRPRYVYFATKTEPVIMWGEVEELKPKPGSLIEVFRLYYDKRNILAVQIGHDYYKSGKIIRRFRKTLFQPEEVFSMS